MGDAVAGSLAVAELFVFACIAVCIVASCVRATIADRRKATRWTEHDDRALDLEAKRHR